MTANALNAAIPTTAAAGGVSPQAGLPGQAGAAAGFDALVAALFPVAGQAQAAAPDPAPLALQTAAATPVAGAITVTTEGQGEAGDGSESGDPSTDANGAGAHAADPNACLAACVVTVAAPLAPPAPKGKSGDPVEDAGLRGRARPLNVLHPVAAQHAALGKAEAAPEADGDAASEAPDATPAEAPPAWGRNKPAGAPAAPALQNANANARLEEKAAADAPPPPAASEPAADTAPEAPRVAASPVTAPAGQATASQLAAAAPPPAPAEPAAKPAKAERKASRETETSDAPRAAAATRPQTPDAVSAAKPAAAARPDKADGNPAAGAEAVEAAPSDQPLPQPTLETRGPTESAAPQAASAPAVRGSPETVANLAAQILKKLEGQSSRFDVELDPHGLGKVNVRIEIGAQGALTAAMSFDNPQAAAEVRSRAAELQKALEQAGFNLAGGLSFDVAHDQGQRQHGQPWQDGETAGRAFRGQAFRAALETAGDAADAAVSGALKLRRGIAAGLDVRV